jgi:hypothetical protein
MLNRLLARQENTGSSGGSADASNVSHFNKMRLAEGRKRGR